MSTLKWTLCCVGILLASTVGIASADTHTLSTNVAADYSVDVTSDIQALIAAASDGDTITFPTRSYNHDTVGYGVDGS